MRIALAAAALGAVVFAGCGPTCQSTCSRIYSPQECDHKVPGVEDWTELYDECVSECENALRYPGELCGVNADGETECYDPDEQHTSGESVTLDNERQAAAWMDCVAERSCESLEDGYCAPL